MTKCQTDGLLFVKNVIPIPDQQVSHQHGQAWQRQMQFWYHCSPQASHSASTHPSKGKPRKNMVIKILSHMISNILNKPIIGISYSRQNAMENWSTCSATAAKLNSSRIEDFKLGLVANWWHHLIYFLNHETCAIEWLRALCILFLVKHQTLNSEHCPFFTWYEMQGERILHSETLIPEKSGRRGSVYVGVWVCGCV